MNPSNIAMPTPQDAAVREALLKDRFARLWTRCVLPGVSSDADQVWRKLAQRYAEPHRHYHDKGHLAHCLDELDVANRLIERPDAVEMAIWFHDVVNEPGDTQNEARSAEFFRRMAHGLMDGGFVDAVVDLILVTTHRHPPDDPDHQFICDIDLASLGCPWECFLRDSAAVKAEFQGPDEEYYRSKRSFLEALLARPKIFSTDFFNERYEGQARDNIRRLLELINQTPGER